MGPHAFQHTMVRPPGYQPSKSNQAMSVHAGHRAVVPSPLFHRVMTLANVTEIYASGADITHRQPNMSVFQKSSFKID
jgi:hypothetical protein